MSFDFAAGDVVKLGQAALALFEACSNASDVFQETAEQCLSIYIAIGQTQKMFVNPDTKLERRFHVELSALTTHCRSTLARLEQVIGRYRSLATPTPKMWDTFRFAMRQLTHDELADIRSKLTIHLLSLNVFLSRAQGDAFNVFARKIDEMKRTLSSGLSDVAAIKDTEVTIAHNQFPSLKDEGIGKAASRSQPPKSNKAQEHQHWGRFTESSLHEAFKAKRQKLESLLESVEDVHESLSLLTAAEQAKLLLPPQEYHYSKTDERLCQLPEGWQRINLNHQDYQYRYLLYAKDIRTRVYNVAKPFNVIIDVESQSLPKGWREVAAGMKGSHYFHADTGTAQFDRPTLLVSNLSDDHFIGWKTREGLPLDLEDICSLELARALNYKDSIPEEDIKSSLPQGWQWYLGKDNRSIYTYTGLKASHSQQYESNIHPIYFLASATTVNDENSHLLPTGWDRRLDTWGCVFYVDHNTQQAQRIHPRDDPNINFATGLPIGWEETIDHNGIKYFFNSSMSHGTYRGTAMRSMTMDEKFVLQSRPTKGDIPPIEDGGPWIQKHSLRRISFDEAQRRRKSI